MIQRVHGSFNYSLAISHEQLFMSIRILFWHFLFEYKIYLPNRDSGLEYIDSAENLHAIRNKKV